MTTSLRPTGIAVACALVLGAACVGPQEATRDDAARTQPDQRTPATDERVTQILEKQVAVAEELVTIAEMRSESMKRRIRSGRGSEDEADRARRAALQARRKLLGYRTELAHQRRDPGEVRKLLDAQLTNLDNQIRVLERRKMRIATLQAAGRAASDADQEIVRQILELRLARLELQQRR